MGRSGGQARRQVPADPQPRPAEERTGQVLRHSGPESGAMSGPIRRSPATLNVGAGPVLLIGPNTTRGLYTSIDWPSTVTLPAETGSVTMTAAAVANVASVLASGACPVDHFAGSVHAPLPPTQFDAAARASVPTAANTMPMNANVRRWVPDGTPEFVSVCIFSLPWKESRRPPVRHDSRRLPDSTLRRKPCKLPAGEKAHKICHIRRI